MDNFGIEIAKRLTKKLGNEFDIIKENLLKVNDQRRNAVILKRKGEAISRCVYLEAYYQMYKRGCSVDSIVDYIIQDTLEDRKYADLGNRISVNEIKDYENVKDKLVVKFLNAEMNAGYLADKMYVPYLDLAAVICILWEDVDGEFASSNISKMLFSNWNVTVEEMYEQALKNTRRLLPEVVRDIGAVMIDMYEKVKGDLSAEDYEVLQSDELDVLYILSNNIYINGAVAMLYDGVLWNFANEHNVEEVVILPSSIHEIILIPKTDEWDFSAEYCRNMVRDVNYREVDYSEVLSYNVYIYNRTTDEVRIWNE